MHALLAAAALALLVMPLSFAGADDPGATSAAVSNKKFKKLKQRVAALEGRGTAPSGPAGGDLTGTYPNPLIASNSVTGEKIPDETLTGFEIAPDSLFDNDLATDSVGRAELKPVIAVVSPGTAITAGNFGNANVSCPAGTVVLGGGWAWLNSEAGTSIVHSAPVTAGAENGTWTVRGRTPGGNTLFGWANCLTV